MNSKRQLTTRSIQVECFRHLPVFFPYLGEVHNFPLDLAAGEATPVALCSAINANR